MRRERGLDWRGQFLVRDAVWSRRHDVGRKEAVPVSEKEALCWICWFLATHMPMSIETLHLVSWKADLQVFDSSTLPTT